MVRTFLKRLGEKFFGTSENKSQCPRPSTRLGFESLESREVPATLLIQSTHNVQAGQQFITTLTGDPNAVVHLAIQDAGGAVNNVTKTLDGNGSFSWSRQFTFAGNATITDTDAGVTSTPDVIHVKPILGIGPGATQHDLANLTPTQWWLNASNTVTVGGYLNLTLVAYNADGSQASNYDGKVTLQSSNPGMVGVVPYVNSDPTQTPGVVVWVPGINGGGGGYVAQRTAEQVNSDNTITYTFSGGLAGATVQGLKYKATVPYVTLTAETTDPSGNIITSQGLRVYVNQG